MMLDVADSYDKLAARAEERRLMDGKSGQPWLEAPKARSAPPTSSALTGVWDPQREQRNDPPPENDGAVST
jgi:hypothetical protein